MKHFLFTLLILLCIQSASSQSATYKNNLSMGFGKGSYNGDLGNSWFNLNEEWYGYGHISYNRYLNKSFDLNTNLTWGDYGRC
jgi:hypothetical protein